MSSQIKNKRGDRGSTDEQDRSFNNSNMATNSTEVLEENANVSDDDLEEPKLLEIKTLLIDIQTSVASVIAENQGIRKEIEDLKSSMKLNGDELKNLRPSLKKTKDKKKPRKCSVDALNIQLKTAKEKLQTQKEECYYKLWENLDHLEQYSRKNTLGIYGAPQDAYTSTESVVISQSS